MDDYIYYAPAAEPPPGLHSNFDHPPGQRAMADALVIVAIGSTTIFAFLRFYTKMFIIGVLHAEDYLIPIAWIAAIGQATCGFLINSVAPLVHSWDLTLYTFGRYLLFLRVGAVCYNISIVLMKVSVLIQILRIFIPNGRLTKAYCAAHALIWSNVIYYTISIFMYILACDPVSKAWKPWLSGKCRNMAVLAISMQVANLVGDLLVLFLAQKIIYDVMRMHQKQRRKLSVLFFAGIVPCSFALLCLVYTSKMVHSYDFSYDSLLMFMACYGELSTGMLVLLLPVLPRFFMHLRTVSFHSFSSSSPRTVAEMFPAQVGHASRKSDAPEPPNRKPSLWHVSYTEMNREDEVELAHRGAIETESGYAERSDSPGKESLDKSQDDRSSASSSASLPCNEEQNMGTGMGIGMAITTSR